ncbi:hypothetical protein [Streptomyces sp. NBC_01751]|uniref:hypothetical protein n=1 Tax=Streptomyces sp. NBC_01751 TaxID=2975929 RepID=UPI002DD80096|nr:hypothetical protein [Streptomyces sp. NBC_01751]WSD23356.1 hypothetical protein OHA26_07630 [Streptomyces sp. NBC_01751]
MTPNELAEYTTDFIGECQARILGIGAEQYSKGDRQKFEDMPLLDLLQYAREEAQDLAVYAAMLDIRFSRLEGLLRAAGN